MLSLLSFVKASCMGQIRCGGHECDSVRTQGCCRSWQSWGEADLVLAAWKSDQAKPALECAVCHVVA